MADTASRLERYRRVRASDARKEFSSILKRVQFGGERIVIVRSGKPVAVLISPVDFEFVSKLEDQTDLAKANKAMKSGPIRPLSRLPKRLQRLHRKKRKQK